MPRIKYLNYKKIRKGFTTSVDAEAWHHYPEYRISCALVYKLTMQKSNKRVYFYSNLS